MTEQSKIPKRCLKCGYEARQSDLRNEEECPNCGAVYKKVEQSLERNSKKGKRTGLKTKGGSVNAAFYQKPVFLVAVVGATLFLILYTINNRNSIMYIASDACDKLKVARYSETAEILRTALKRAEAIGRAGPQLGDEMRRRCPSLMEFISRASERSEPKANLRSKMDVKIKACRRDDALGLVTNNSKLVVDLFIRVDFIDENGTINYQGIDSIYGLPPGESARWKANNLSRTPKRCRARLSGIYSQ